MPHDRLLDPYPGDGVTFALIFPHPVSQDELRAAFSPGNAWGIAAIKPDRVQTRYHGDAGAQAWLVTIKRI